MEIKNHWVQLDNLGIAGTQQLNSVCVCVCTNQ